MRDGDTGRVSECDERMCKRNSVGRRRERREGERVQGENTRGSREERTGKCVGGVQSEYEVSEGDVRSSDHKHSFASFYSLHPLRNCGILSCGDGECQRCIVKQDLS